MSDRRYVYFLSDLHLGAQYFDNPKEAEARAVRFLESIKDSAAAVYLLGDVLDYWYEYRHVVPRGYVRFFGKLAELSDSGVRITWLIGNHDIWIFDYLPGELGIRVIDGTLTENICGKTIFMAHGDAQSGGSRWFRMMRSLFRNKFCQTLYAAIHPRWTIPFATAWSGLSRETDGLPKDSTTDTLLSPLREFAEKYSDSHPDIDIFMFGHLHICCRESIASGKELIVLGDWLDQCTYVRLSATGSLELLSFLS